VQSLACQLSQLKHRNSGVVQTSLPHRCKARRCGMWSCMWTWILQLYYLFRAYWKSQNQQESTVDAQFASDCDQLSWCFRRRYLRVCCPLFVLMRSLVLGVVDFFFCSAFMVVCVNQMKLLSIDAAAISWWKIEKKNEVTPCCDLFRFFLVSATVSFSLATGVGCNRDFCSTLQIAFLFQMLVFYGLSLDLHVD